MEEEGKRLDLAVIESRWYDTSNDSVRGLFDLLAGMLKDNPFAYHYEMFNTAESLREIIRRVSKQKDIHNVYIAAHGTEDRKYLHAAGERISRTQLRNSLEAISPRRLHGMFFGSCGFGLQSEVIMESTGLTWIAGYTEFIDWIHSSAMDLYFWNAFYSSSVPRARKRKKRAAAMLHLLLELRHRVPSLFSELGFRVTLAWEKGAFLTFPDDFHEYIEDRLPAVRRFVAEHPGSWS